MNLQPSSASRVDTEQLEDAVAHLSKKWSVSIVHTLLTEGPMGFSALQDHLDGVSGKVLSDCLDAFQERGVVERRVIQEEPLRVEYDLTEKGSDLEPVVRALEDWTNEYLDAESATVLLVEDDRRLVEMHETWLEEDFDVRAATDGESARELLTDEVDVLVTDRRTAGLSGPQLAQFVELSGFDCAIVFLSSMPVDETLLDVRFDDYVRKPTSPEDLRELVDRWHSIVEQGEDRREYESVTSRMSLFESALGQDQLRGNDTLSSLRERVAELDADGGEPQSSHPTADETNERQV